MASFKFEEDVQYMISKGPDKARLIVSQWHGDRTERIPVKFKVFKDGGSCWVDLIVNGADREDGSGENWLLKGYVLQSGGSFGQRFEAFFSIGTRGGWMKFYPA